MGTTDKLQHLQQYLQQNPHAVGKVVDYDRTTGQLYTFDFSANNTELSPDDVNDTAKFSAWIDSKLHDGGYRYGIGGYMEHRTLYARSALFNTEEEPRRLHLGVDIWAAARTPVYAPLQGKVHSFQNNDHFGDYGPTIILEHDLDGLTLYTLYGHLNKACLEDLYEGMSISIGQRIATFGNAVENGSWPPHLHFQLMFDMEGRKGDYPGVGTYSQQAALKQNIPDPELLLRFNS